MQRTLRLVIRSQQILLRLELPIDQRSRSKTVTFVIFSPGPIIVITGIRACTVITFNVIRLFLFGFEDRGRA